MVTTGKDPLIFNATSADLVRFYDGFADRAVLQNLVQCHEKLRSKTRSMLHVTFNLPAIMESGKLLMSAGGLAGCLYGIPIYEDGTVHNLAPYIIKHELPMFLRNQHRPNTVAGITITPHASRMGYVDYLMFGYAYMECHNRSLNAIVESKALDQKNHEQAIVAERLSHSLNSSMSLTQKMGVIERAIQDSYIMRMLYFEIVLEYIFIFQNDEKALMALQKQELYTNHAKDMIFRLNPELAVHFSLKYFHVSPRAIHDYLLQTRSNGKIITNYTRNHFYDYLVQRICFYTQYYLLEKPENLRGHVLFRYFDARPRLEAYLADKLWRQAAAEDYQLLTYRLPKGEVGLLPTAPADFYVCDLSKRYAQGKQLGITLDPHLAVNKTIMRNPYAKG